jgi:hypothetical protein
MRVGPRYENLCKSEINNIRLHRLFLLTRLFNLYKTIALTHALTTPPNPS